MLILIMSDFLFITHDNHDPYFNLASEEYLLRQKGGYYIYLWVNSPAVIVGINQNTLQEVNLGFTQDNGIKVVRRQTGGGAVYHDLDNICYTVIAPFDKDADNYRKFTAPVIEYLNSIGVKAEFSGRNDITVDGKKISGNAQTVADGRIMHHGTLLFHTDMSVLSSALKPNKLKMESKGIKSVRARVGNIYDYLPVKTSAAEFLKGLSEFFKKSCTEYVFNEEDVAAINKLVEDKYSRYEWNVGRSPKGENSFEAKFDFGMFRMDFDTEKGLMKNVKITGDFFSVKPVGELEKLLEGTRFDKASFARVTENLSDYIVNGNGSDLTEKIFG